MKTCIILGMILIFLSGGNFVAGLVSGDCFHFIIAAVCGIAGVITIKYW